MRGYIYTSQQFSCYLFGLGLTKPPGELHREASGGVKMSLEVEHSEDVKELLEMLKISTPEESNTFLISC